MKWRNRRTSDNVEDRRAGEPTYSTGLLGVLLQDVRDKAFLWEAFIADSAYAFEERIKQYAEFAGISENAALQRLEDLKEEFIEEQARLAYETGQAIPTSENPDLADYKAYVELEFNKRQQVIQEQHSRAVEKNERNNAVDEWYRKAKERFNPSNERVYTHLAEDNLWYDDRGDIVGLSKDDVPDDWTNLKYN